MRLFIADSDEVRDLPLWSMVAGTRCARIEVDISEIRMGCASGSHPGVAIDALANVRRCLIPGAELVLV